MRVARFSRSPATGNWPLAAYGLALLIGLAMAGTLIPLDKILGIGQLDLNFAEGDRIQHIVGQRYFIADAWRWPLLVTRLLGAPDGTNISLTDSIPLLALPAKLLRRWLPPGFHTIFTWLALSYVLQPVAAVFALRGAGERRLLPAVAVAVMAESMPSFLYRYIHASLSGHFLILLALGCYLRCVAGRRSAAWLGPMVLLPVSLLVHPYLMVMVAALLAAAPVSLLLASDPGWRRAASGLACGGVLLAVTSVVCGYGGEAPLAGYGFYAMDLLAPFRPEHSALWPAAWVGAAAGAEDYQYLGAGLLLLLAAAAIGWMVRGRPRLVRHRGLVLAACALVALAVSARVQVGQHVLLSLEPMPRFLNQLRSSARLFWPVAYILLVGGIVAVMRSLPRAPALAVIAAAALLQFADAATLRGHVYVALHEDVPWPAIILPLRPLLAASRTLTFWPPFGCGSDVSNDPGFLETLLLASRTVIPTNSMYLARANPQVDCRVALHVGGPLEPGELRVFLTQVGVAAPVIVPDGADLCRAVGPLAVCTRLPLPGLPVIVPPAVPLDRVLDIGTWAADSALGTGWGPLERDGIWTEGKLALITMRRPGPGPLHLTVWGRGYAPGSMRSQGVTVSADDHTVAEWSALPGPIQRFDADLPAAVDGWLVVRLAVARPVRPIDAEGVPDTRHLGFFVVGYEVKEKPGQGALLPTPPGMGPPLRAEP